MSIFGRTFKFIAAPVGMIISLPISCIGIVCIPFEYIITGNKPYNSVLMATTTGKVGYYIMQSPDCF
jgi:hypothetical protein